MLLSAHVMLGDFKCLRDVTRHGEVDLSAFVVPIEGDSNVSLTVPFCSNAVIIL